MQVPQPDYHKDWEPQYKVRPTWGLAWGLLWRMYILAIPLYILIMIITAIVQ